MTEEPGRRERKKQQTRQALITAAVRLFEQQGYERTTVAEIAEAADVSTRTFFLHFPAKEDVLLANSQVRVEIGLQEIANRGPGELPSTVLARAVEGMITNTLQTDLPEGVTGLRASLATSSPTLQARMLERVLSAHAELADALHQAYSDQLDQIEAAALVGAMVGAVGAAALASLRAEQDAEQVREAMRRAAALAIAAR